MDACRVFGLGVQIMVTLSTSEGDRLLRANAGEALSAAVFPQDFVWGVATSAARIGLIWVGVETPERIVEESALLYSHIVRNDGIPKEQAA